MFDGGGSAFDSEIWGDGEQLIQAFRRRERIYLDYARAIAWEDKHMAKLIASARSGKLIPVLAPPSTRPSTPAPVATAATSKRHWLQQLFFPG